MATVTGTIKGIKMLREAVSSGHGNIALVTFTMSAYTASSDNGQLGGSTTLATEIQNRRRDGKTVTLLGAVHAESGLQGSTEYYSATWAVSSGNLTFNVANSALSEIDAASGVSDRPMAAIVSYAIS